MFLLRKLFMIQPLQLLKRENFVLKKSTFSRLVIFSCHIYIGFWKIYRKYTYSLNFFLKKKIFYVFKNKKKTCVTFSFVKPKQKNQKTFFHASLFLQKESKNQNHASRFSFFKKKEQKKSFTCIMFFSFTSGTPPCEARGVRWY